MKTQTENIKQENQTDNVSRLDAVVMLRCGCGLAFERPKFYEEENNVMFRWKIKYCDKCYKKRVNKSLKRLPEIIKCLMEAT